MACSIFNCCEIDLQGREGEPGRIESQRFEFTLIFWYVLHRSLDLIGKWVSYADSLLNWTNLIRAVLFVNGLLTTGTKVVITLATQISWACWILNPLNIPNTPHAYSSVHPHPYLPPHISWRKARNVLSTDIHPLIRHPLILKRMFQSLFYLWKELIAKYSLLSSPPLTSTDDGLL